MDQNPTNKQAAASKLAYSVKQAAANNGLSQKFLYKEIKVGALKARRAGSKILILASDLESYLRHLPRYNEPQGGRTKGARLMYEHEGCEA